MPQQAVKVKRFKEPPPPLPLPHPPAFHLDKQRAIEQKIQFWIGYCERGVAPRPRLFRAFSRVGLAWLNSTGASWILSGLAYTDALP